MLVLEARAQRAALEALVAQNSGVRRVMDAEQLEAGPTPLSRLRLEVEGPGTAEALSLQLAQGGHAIRELRREQTSLEDVFALLTTREIGAQAEPAAEGA